MTRTRAALVATALLGVLVPATARAQTAPLVLDLRGGVGVPVGSFADPDRGWEGRAGEGGSFGVHFVYAVRSRIHAYLGFGQDRFTCDRAACGAPDDLVATRWDLGTRVTFLSGRTIPWVQVALVSGRVEARRGDEDGGMDLRPALSGRATGVEAGVGFALRATERLTLGPGLRVVGLGPTFSDRGKLAMRYVVADVGVLLGF